MDDDDGLRVKAVKNKQRTGKEKTETSQTESSFGYFKGSKARHQLISSLHKQCPLMVENRTITGVVEFSPTTGT